jgi:hypothetical protein
MLLCGIRPLRETDHDSAFPHLLHKLRYLITGLVEVVVPNVTHTSFRGIKATVIPTHMNIPKHGTTALLDKV